MNDNLRQDDAVVGEAAGVAMGLVMLGTGSRIAAKDMIEVKNSHIKYFDYLSLLSLSLSL